MNEGKVMKRNLLRAIGVIVCGAVALCGLGTLWDAAKGMTALSSLGASPASLASVFAQQEYCGDFDRLPKGFEEELFPLDLFYDVRVSGKGGVIGLLSHSSIEEASGFCESELVRRGWTKVESGHEACASFVKTQATYTWLFMSCVEINGDTSVLVSLA